MAKLQRSARVATTDVREALRERFKAPEYAYLQEVGNGTGSNARRHADGLAMSLWPSRGIELHGIEIKVSRNDWLKELGDPAKADEIARFCDRWWVAAGDESIHQWDSLEKRNPVSWYVYHGGSLASQWHLTGGAWRAITAVALQPSMWHGENAHHGRDALFILDGAVDMKEDSGNAIFPETLRSEFHGIRGTIEAYSRGAKLGGREQASACGHRAVGATVRVDAGSGVVSEYQIDRWE